MQTNKAAKGSWVVAQLTWQTGGAAAVYYLTGQS